jgi:hypothetical protein
MKPQMNADKRRSLETPGAKFHLHIGDVWRTTGIVGGIVVLGMLVIFLAGVPQTRFFVLLTIVLGVLLGLLLWWRRR